MIQIIYLALGSNVGGRQENILRAIELLKEKVSKIKMGGIYETAPYGYKEQDNFLNTVIRGETTLTPSELLSFVKDVEKRVGRVERFRWGPREMDIDIIFYGNNVYSDDDLVIPHPRMRERDFVLQPLLDLDPKVVHPILGKTVRDLFGSLSKGGKSIIRKLSKEE